MNELALKRKGDALFKKLVLADAPFYFLKVHGSAYQRANQPDFFLCVAGWLCVVELKHPNEKAEPNPGQANEMRKWERAGAKKITLNSMTALSDFLLLTFTQQGVALNAEQLQLLRNARD